MKKYKHTLNLPKTNFPIKSNPQREEELVEIWDRENIYKSFSETGENTFKLHDGPPYANGHLHHGHILNKVLKDIIVKFHSLLGEKVEFIPGWDCHGLPIEAEVDSKLGPKRHDMFKFELRQKYREYAEKYINIQRDEFKRLGILADWNNPYKTMDYKYEAQILRELSKFINNGLLYRSEKPVYWCPTHRTALANSEVDHQDHESPSIYFLYKLDTEDYIAVWTTTPWTLPGNQAIACNFTANYTQYKLGDGRKIWVATELLESFLSFINEKFNKENVLISGPGTRFCGLGYRGHFNYGGIIRHSDHVNLESGTGFVHIAPAHGEDDFNLRQKDKGLGLLPLINVIGDNGKTVDGLGIRAGLTIEEANNEVIDFLYENNLLLRSTTVKHKYPYSDRSHKPVITKTTTQWFINIDKPYNNGPSLRERALSALDEVEWIPRHGYNRIKGMLKTRPDWCLSRQRVWGIPIPAILCKKCGHYEFYQIGDDKSLEFLALKFETYGSDIWFEMKPTKKCPKCNEDLEICEDIVDVWFDSGVSNAAVMGGEQVDLYLEGSDQHRGWFQSTLLSTLGARELIPYKSVLTHGFVVDDKGEKLSKSKGNYLNPFKLIKQYGAEILRLWVASSEFKNDIKFSEEILSGVKQTAHKIRNTVRYMIAATDDFDITKRYFQPLLNELDKYILNKWNDILHECLNAYKNYEFHTVVKNVENFCILELSSFYFEAIKDRLYCDSINSDRRCAAQYVLYLIAHDIIKIMSPIMSFTMDDAWRYITKNPYNSVFLSTLLDIGRVKFQVNAEIIDEIKELRRLAYAKLEKLRNTGDIGSFLEANVTFILPDELINKYKDIELSDILCVSNVYLEVGQELLVSVEKAHQDQCQRCWKHSEINGDVCDRCSSVLQEIE